MVSHRKWLDKPHTYNEKGHLVAAGTRGSGFNTTRYVVGSGPRKDQTNPPRNIRRIRLTFYFYLLQLSSTIRLTGDRNANSYVYPPTWYIIDTDQKKLLHCEGHRRSRLGCASYN